MNARPVMLSAALVVGLALVVAVPSARAGEQIYVSVSGQRQGVFTGWYNAMEGYGEVEDFAWSMLSPRDAASGLPTGKTQLKPVTFRVRMSAATLWLANAQGSNENLTTVRARWYEPGTDGEPTLVRELVLTNANVSSYSVYTTREESGLVTWVDFAMTFQKIGIENTLGGLSFELDWETPIR